MSNQGTQEWLNDRAGKVTASMISNVMMKPETAGYQNYLSQIVAEIITGKPQGSDYTNQYMQYGTETEPLARSAYEVDANAIVTEVGFCEHPTIARAGASPDGLVGYDGLLEIKCPKVSTHLSYLTAGTVPAQYKNQMMWQMACTGRNWCDFASFCPDLPVNMQLFLIRFYRNPERIVELESAVIAFLDAAEKIVVQLKKV